MAQRTVDDLDGQTLADSYTISVNGYLVGIDLGPDNFEQLAAALAPYFKAGRVVRGLPPHPALAQVTEEQPAAGEHVIMTTAPLTSDRVITALNHVAADNATIRTWWRANEGKAKLGLPPFTAKGVIPAPVKDAFNAAHQP